MASGTIHNLVNDVLYEKGVSTSGTLSHAYTDYKYLLMIGAVNSFNTSLLIPTEEITSDKMYQLVFMGANSFGQQSSIPYMAYMVCTFSALTFNERNVYTNNQYQMSVYKIIGIK